MNSLNLTGITMKRPIVAGVRACALVVLLLGLQTSVQSDPQKLPLDLQEHVNTAIQRGVEFLGKTQLPTGSWNKDSHTVGYAALPALTLLECGVARTDVSIQMAARHVREKASDLTGTYEIALSILFLDRLGNPQDRLIIQVLAMRLVAGQTVTGGWGYSCPKTSAQTHNDMLALLRMLEPPAFENLIAPPKNNDMPNIIPGQQPNFPNPLDKDGKFQNPLGKEGDKFGQIIPGKEPSSGSQKPLPKTDKDKTGHPKNPKGQIVPVDIDPLARENIQTWEPPQRRFPTIGVRGGLCLKSEEDPNQEFIPRKLVQRPKGFVRIPPHFAWIPVLNPVEMLPLIEGEVKGANYNPFGRTDNSNSQFAILALWAARRHDVPTERSLGLLLRRFVTSQEKTGGWNYAYKMGGAGGDTPAMTCVGLLGMAVGHGLAKEYEGPLRDKVAQDERIINGFVNLAKTIGEPTGKWNNLPMQNLYYLWALERVSVIYNLPTIGPKDWYRWAAELLVANQDPEWGNWDKSGYPGSTPVIDTCLALLVLKRANLAKDLAFNLPFDPQKLNEQIAAKLGVPLQKESPKTSTPPPKPEPEPKIETPIKPEPTPQPMPETKPTAAPAPAAAPAPQPSGVPLWVWIVGLLVLLVAALALVYYLSNRNRGDDEEDEEKEDQEERWRRKKKQAKSRR